MASGLGTDTQTHTYLHQSNFKKPGACQPQMFRNCEIWSYIEKLYNLLSLVRAN